MRIRRGIITVLGTAMLLVPVTGRAATTHTIDTDCGTDTGCLWIPDRTHAEVGDTITWDFGSVHNLEKYLGDGAHFSAETSAGSYSRTVEAGQVWFRCRIHSKFIGNVCHQMCGAYTNRTTAPNAPTITSPPSGAQVPGTVTVSGKAEPYMLVTVYRAPGTFWRAMSNASGDWSTTVSLTPGNVNLYAVAYDAEDRASPSGQPITLSVGAGDVSPPSVTIESPTNNEIIVGRRVVVRGTASDDTGVASIRVWVQTAQCDDWTCGYTVHRDATCEGCSFPSAPGQTVTWTSRSFDTIGYVVIRAEAVDLAGRRTFTENRYYFHADGGWLAPFCPVCGE